MGEWFNSLSKAGKVVACIVVVVAILVALGLATNS